MSMVQQDDGPDIHAAWTNHHRRCGSALAGLQLLIAGEPGAAALHVEALRELDRALRLVSSELSAAGNSVIDMLAGSGRQRSAALVLAGRLDRLHAAMRDVGAAITAGDLPWLRRSLTRFEAFAHATCVVQRDVYASAISGTRADPPILRARPGRGVPPQGKNARAVNMFT